MWPTHQKNLVTECLTQELCLDGTQHPQFKAVLY